MALFDIFKKKKKGAREEPAKPVEVKIEKKEPEAEIKRQPAQPGPGPARAWQAKKISKVAYRVLKEPHITEKATDLARHGQYIFKVYKGVNKIEVKKAIEGLYNVDVRDVKIIKAQAKRRRLGRIEGRTKGYKKAIVKLKQGQKIELLPR